MAMQKRRAARGPALTKAAAGSIFARLLRIFRPPITLGLIVRALVGIVLFLCGLLYGIWLIVRFRRWHAEDDRPS